MPLWALVSNSEPGMRLESGLVVDCACVPAFVRMEWRVRVGGQNGVAIRTQDCDRMRMGQGRSLPATGDEAYVEDPMLHGRSSVC